MRKTVNTQQQLKKGQEKKIFYIKVEKLIREASDTFIYYKDYPTALKLVEEALQIEPVNSKAFILKGHLLLCTNHEERALKYFKKAISADLFSAEAHGAIAGTLYMLGRHQEAFNYNEKAFEFLTPKDKSMLPSLYDQKISMLIQMRKYEEARFMLQKSTKYLSTEDSCNLLSNYQETIKNHCKLRKLKKQKLAKIALKLV